MKKCIFFLAVLLNVMSVMASSQLTLAPFYAWGDGMHVKGNEVTCDDNKSWQGAQIWIGSDLSSYDYIWMEMNACQGPFELTIEYVSGDSRESVNIESGEYVAYIALDAEKKNNVKKIELKNRDNGGSMTIAGIYAGTTAQWQAAMADFREELDFQYFQGDWEKASWNAETKTMTMTEDWGRGSWWSIGNKSDYYKAVVNFAEATTAGGNLTVTYEGEASETNSKQDFYSGATSVSVNLNTTLNDHINQIYIQGAESGNSYTFRDAYLMKTPETPMAVREGEGSRNLGQFKAYNDGLTVDGNTITWDNNQSWKGCDTWLGQDLSACDYMWLLVEVNGSIKMSLQYGDNSTAEKVLSTGTPFVGFELNDAQKQATNKIMLQNTANGGSITIKQVVVGSEAEYEAAKAAYLQEMDWTGFKELWSTTVTGKTATMSGGWGNAGWELSGDYSAYTKVLVEFAVPVPCAGGVTVDYTYEDGDNTYQGFGMNDTYVELTLDNSRKVSVVRIRVALENNGASCTLKSVALVKDFSAPLALDEESGDNPTALAFRNGAVSDVTLNREFIADGAWYTLCLPFDLNEDQIAASFGDCQIMQLTESYMKGIDALYLQFDEVATIEAGKPYLFMPSNDISDLTFTDVTIDATEPTAYPEGASQLATMTGTYSRPQLTSDKYVLIADNTLAPSNGNWIRAFRAWFELNPSMPAQVKARCVFGRQIPTDKEQVSANPQPIKMIQNGQLYIIKDGVQYTIMGQIAK